MKKKSIKAIWSGISAIIISFMVTASSAFADGAITISPLSQKLILDPGETYYGSFKIVNQAGNNEDLKYAVSIEPFFVNEDYEIYYENNGDYNMMVDWITVYNTSGTLSPNSNAEIRFSITVPDDAPAGGQYAAIKATSINDDVANAEGLSTSVKVQYGVAYTIFADITGTTERSGEILETNVPGFIFDGNIMGTTTVKNTGNVHGTAKYTLQVFPLFSDEEIYTNEEDPQKMNIMPERTFYNETSWSETPLFGIFNVIYTIEFEGVTQQVSKMVIKCPIWLLFLIVLAIIALIMWFFLMAKKRKTSRG